MAEEMRVHTGKCVDCGTPLELHEIDFKKGRRVLLCRRCGLFHLYEKNVFGKWKLVKATKGF